MIYFLATDSGFIRLTVHEVILVGAVMVFFAVVSRRFELATALAVPLMGIATVNQLVTGPTKSAATRPTKARPAAGPPAAPRAHHGFPWFTAGVAMVAALLALALLVVLVVFLRTREDDIFGEDELYDPDDWYDVSGFDGYSPYPDDPDNHRGDGPARFAPWAQTARAQTDTRDGLCGRLAVVTREFLTSIREGWPIRLDARSPKAMWFLDALIRAARVVADDKDRRRIRLRAAVSEVELRWRKIRDDPENDDGAPSRNIHEPF